MLQVIRDRAQGVIAWFIIFLIVVPFALWGINDYMGGGKEKPLAEVNGAAISKEQLQNAYLQQRQRLEQMLGSSFRPEMFDEARMKKAILDDLVERELVVQYAKDAGLRVSDAAMAGVIRSVEAFHENGQFSRAAYERALRARGFSPASFEADVRRDMVSEQWRNGLQQSAFVTKAEMERFARLQNQTRDFGYALFPVEKFVAKVSVSDDEVKQYYEQNKASFTEPEMVRVAYLELSANQMAGEIAVSDDDVRAYYAAHSDEFSEPESRRASHILFRVEGNSAEADQAARNQAEETLKRLRAGEKFADLARKLSQDTGSATKGGDLGFFGRGAMVPEFDAKVFSLKKGELSEPVRTSFGYHIIRLEEVRGGDVKPLDQARAQIQAKLRADKAQERFYEAAEKLNNLTYEHPETLQVAAEELKLPIKHSGYFTRQGGAGLPADPKFVQAAFNEEVLEQGNNSDTVELAPDHLVVLRLEDRRPEAQRPLNDVRPQIVAQLRQVKAKADARAAADKALAAIQSGADAASLAKQEGGTWVNHKGIGRSDSQVPRPVLETAFRLPRPGTAPSVDRAALPTGDEAVVVLQGVKDGEPANAADQPQAQAAAVVRADAEASYQGAITTLRKLGSIEIHEDKM
jgi:peptidyl-prolyl cis-trans isomerase D